MAIRTDYQTVLEIDTATPISEGKMRADGGDIRMFEDTAHAEALEFYIDPTTLNTTATRIHIKQNLPTGRYHPGIAFYAPLDETSGSAVDLIDGKTGTASGGVTQGVAAQIGNGAEFDGTNGLIQFTANDDFDIYNKTALSCEAWINWASLPNVFPRIVDHDVSSTGWRFITAAGASGDYQLSANVQYSTTDAAASSTDLDFNKWYHVVFVWESSTDLITLYVNGVNATDSQTAGSGSVPSDSAANFDIGNEGGIRSPDGIIDNVAIYHRALTAAEIRSSYLRGLAGKRLQEPTPASAWSMNSSNNAGSEVVDIINGNNGSASGSISVGQQGRVGQAFNFDGSTSYVEVLDSSTFDSAAHLGANGVMTLAATITLEDDSATNAILTNFDAATNQEFSFSVFTGALPQLFVSEGTAGNFRTVRSDIPIPLNTPVHIAVVYDESLQPPETEMVKIYIDGTLVSRTLSGTAGSFTGMVNSTASYLIGAFDSSSLPGSAGSHFDGLIHELGWFDAALSDAQISELARRSREGLRPNLTDNALDALAYWSFDNKDVGRDPQDIFGNEHAEITNDSAGTEILQGQPSISGESFFFERTTAGTGSAQPQLRANLLTDNVAMSPGTDDFSIAAWVKVNAATPASQFQYIITRVAAFFAEGGADELDLYVNANAGDAASVFWQSSAGGTVSFSGTTPLSDNEWHHIVAVGDRTNTTAYIYVDGREENNGSMSGLGTIDFDAATPIVIGNFPSTGSGTLMFGGNISGVEYYDQALNADQVQDLYQKGLADAGTVSDAKRIYVTYGDSSKTSASSAANTFVREITGLVHAYTFDETNGSTVTDASGSDNGTIAGNVSVENGITGLARNTNGEGVVDFTTQNIPTGNASILTTFRTTADNQVLWSNYDGYASSTGLSLEITSDGYVQARHMVGSGDNALATGSTAVDDGISHTVVVTKNDSTLNVYLDGYSIEATDSMTSADATASTNYRIGGYKNLVSLPSGAVLHLEADQITDGYLTGTLLDTWPDISGSENDATSTGSNRPTYSSNGLNGQPTVIVPDGTFMIPTTPIDLSSDDATLFAVIEPLETYDSSGQFALFTEDPFINPGMNMGFGNVTGSLVNETFGWIATSSNRGAGDTTGTSLPAGIPFILKTGINGTTVDISYDAAGVSITTFGTINTGTSQGWGPFNRLFGRTTAGFPSLTGKISALLIWDRRLTTAEDLQVERYLTLKYGTPNSDLPGQTRADASFDEVRVFDRVLTTNEIEDLMESYAEPAGSRAQVRKRNDPEPVLVTNL